MKESTTRWGVALHLVLQRCRRFTRCLLAFALAFAGGAAYSQTVTTTNLTASPSPAYVGQTVTLTATVTGTSPTGTVTFKDGATTLGTATLSSGKATRSLTFSAAGNRELTAVYAGNTGNSASTSNFVILTVSPKNDTSTELVSNRSQAYVGQNLVLTATVTGVSPTGTVTFKDGTTTLGSSSISAGKATLTKSLSTTGLRNLTAAYGGNTANNTSTSAPIGVTINPKNITTTDLTASPNPALVGQSVTLTATVNGVNPTGTVTFKDGATTLSSATLSSGKATLSRTFSTAGVRSLTASYAGDTANAASTSPVVSETINLNTTATSLSASAPVAEIGQSIVLTATVAGVGATGTVTFKDGDTTLGTGTLSGGKSALTTGFGTAGSHSLTVSYAGNATNAAGTSAAIEVLVSPSATATTLSATPNPVNPGQSITLTATVAGANPSGTVTFRNGNTLLGTAVLSAGKANLATSIATAGLYSLSAAYGGDPANQPSASQTLLQLVGSDPNDAPPTALTWNYLYDTNGNLTQAADPNGNVTNHDYDLLNRRVQTIQPTPASGQARPIIGIAYDGQGRVTQVTDPRNLVTAYTVDGLGNTTAQQSPDAGNSNATFNELGQALTLTDGRGKVTSYSYDALNRLTNVSYLTGVGTVFTYDQGSNAIGKLSSFSDESGSTSYGYDGLGRVIRKTQLSGPANRSFSVAYAWGSTGGATGQLQSITYPSGVNVVYNHDGAGRISAVAVNGGALLNNLSYNPLGAAQSWRWGDGVAYKRSFDAHGRLASYPLGHPSGVGASQGMTRNVTYDSAGRITGYTHATDTGPHTVWDQSFRHDDLDRLTQSLGGTNYSYAYDASGNRTAQTAGGAAYTHAVSATSNRLSSVQTAGNANTVNHAITYDTAGNTLANGRSTATYSDRGRLAALTVASGAGTATVSYLYNALEQRLYKAGPAGVVPTGVAYYVYDEQGQVLGEYDAQGQPVYEVIWLNNMPVGVIKQTRTGSGPTQVVSTQVDYIYADHLNTPRVIARGLPSTDHRIVWRWDATEPFGVTLADENPTGAGVYAFNLRLPGQVFDRESSLHYNWHRDYEAWVGRYTQSDPIGLDGGINTYTYVKSAPLTRFDFLGLNSCGSGWNEPIVPNNPLGFRFLGCCQAHDKCYGNCAYTFGQGGCDGDFKKCMEASCGRHKGIAYTSCVASAGGYYYVVSEFGQNAYKEARKNCPTADCKLPPLPPNLPDKPDIPTF
jgi:RHS repeat-associated protein